MTLPAPNLDDLRFQSDLVDEARRRIINFCPEWTEYNLSDPGITLIELFAWMTELMVYRLNRVPDKNYLKFLDMLGLQRMPASSAHTELTFWLSAPLPLSRENRQTVTVPQGFEVRSEMTDEEVLFTSDSTLEIIPPVLTHLRKEQEFNKNYLSRLGIEIFYPFDQREPRVGDTFYLGFDPDHNISGHILRLNFTAEPTEAVGIRREDPPWIWECLTADGIWHELKLSTADGEKDTTGGLNNPTGQLVLYLPLSANPANLHGINAFWLRCRIEQRNALQGMYSESPKVIGVEAYSLGAKTTAMHSVAIESETLGRSTGEAGQIFTLAHSPILTLRAGETLEVEETRHGEDVFVPWQQVDDFSKSTRFDRHYHLDMDSGTIRFGPSVRQPDSTVIQYGRTPESGRQVRFSRYRYGGGVRGNLPIGSLSTMSMSVAYVSRVSNLTRAVSGRDQETLDEMKMRAQRELQAQRRAVTAQDYEQFTLSCSRAVARTRCLTPNDPNGVAGTVSILVVPDVPDSLRAGSIKSLHLDDKLQKEIRTYLDKYRLITTSLNIREPRYTGVKVKARIVPHDFIPPTEVARQVNEELQRYLAPLVFDDKQPVLQIGEKWEGWPFGRDLFTAEVISLIQQVPTVKYVLDVEVSSRPIVPVEESNNTEEVAEVPLTPVDKVLQLPDDGLLLSLTHEIECVDITIAYKKG